MLKRLGGLSRSAIKKTRSLLGAERDKADPSTAVSSETPEGSGNGGREDDERVENPIGDDQDRSAGGSDGEGGRAARAGRKNPGKRAGRRAGRNPGKGEGGGVDGGLAESGAGPRVVPRGEHSVSRAAFSRSALKVLERLHEGGFGAYLVGGGVRDALVGIAPKDFDVATDASPEDVRALFRNSRIIGRRFRLVHVVFGREIIEVATFRAAHDKGEGGEVGASGRIVRDNVFGSIAEDARRRDFSVNALYYNIADRSVVDYVGGLEDLERGVFRLIGDPLTRCEEDPVRVLRAVRLAAKLGFSIEPATLAAMREVAPELRHTPPARLFEEVLKLFQGGYAERSFAAVIEHELLGYLFPMLERRLGGDDATLRTMLDAALANTDRRVAQGKPITPAYLLAFMLWPDVEEQARADCAAGVPLHEALQEASDRVLARQLKVISIPRRFSGPMKEIWHMQPRLERYRGRRALALLDQRRFRAAYDFLCLRARVDERLSGSAEWWTDVQEMEAAEREEAAAERVPVSGLWGDGAVGESAELPPVPSEEPIERPGSGGGGRRRRRGGRRRGGASEGESDREASSGGHRDGDVGDGTPIARTDQEPPAETPRAGSTVGGEGGGDDGGERVPAEGGEAAPKKKRRRRRRRPGGDRGRTPGGEG